MDTDEKLRLRAKGQALEAGMNIGKQGVSDSVAEEVARQLDEHRLFKVRFLAASRDERTTEEMAQDLAKRTGSELVEVRGHTALYWKARARKAAPREQGKGGRAGSR